MKRDKIFTGLIAWALALLTALAGIGCIVTGFGLAVSDWKLILIFCAVFAAIAALCCSFRWGALALPVAAVILLLPGWREAVISVQVLLNQISILFDRAYGWGIIPLYASEGSNASSVEPALTIMAIPVIAGICWTVCRRKWVGFGLLAGLMPMILCCVVTNTVPSVWSVTLLLFALLMLTLTQFARRRDPRAGNRFAAIVLIPAILISLLLPRYAARFDHSQQAQLLQDRLLEWVEQVKVKLWQVPEPDVPAISPGSTEQYESVDLSQLGPLKVRANPYMYIDVRHDGVDATYEGFLYLRGTSYSMYTGTGWLAQADTASENGWPYAGLDRVAMIYITMQYGSVYNRFFPYYIQEENWTSQLDQGTLMDEWALRYYSFGYYTCSGSAEYTPLNEQETETYLALPQTTQAAAEVILDELFGDRVLTADEKAGLIAEYVRNSAVYDLNTEKMPEDADDFAIWFLKNGDTGYCVHFSTAATVLLRAAGVPARYVTGYLTYIADNQAVVTNDQAHAWVEYLDPDQGWAVLEATPGSQERIEPTDPTEPSVTDPTEESTEVPTAPTESSVAPTEAPTAPTEDSVAPSRETQPSATSEDPPGGDTATVDLTWLFHVLGALLIWALLAAQHWLRRRIRRKKLMQGDNNRQALRRWRYVRRAVRILKQPTPEHLQALAEKAAFSQHILTDGELEQFDLWLQKAKRQLLTKPWPIRLALWLIYAI